MLKRMLTALLAVLESKFTLSSAHKSLHDEQEASKIEISHVGIGSANTFHGYPGCKVRAEVTAIHCVLPIQGSPSSSGSEGNAIYFKGKLSKKEFNMLHL